MATQHELKWPDYFVLDQIAKSGNLDDFILSKQLGCPRSFLLDRLHQLQKEEYIAPIPNGYRLTEKGATEHIPFTDYNFSKKNAPDLFDWKKPYAPAAGWQD